MLRFQCGESEKINNALQVMAIPGAANGEQRYNLAANTLFSFAQSDRQHILPAGRDVLDKMIAKITANGSSLRKITVTGYTDRIGSAANNLRLSQERAATVRDYLVTGGIDNRLVHVIGMGNSNPVIFCPGTNGVVVINCLQPNRRVMLDVNGEQR